MVLDTSHAFTSFHVVFGIFLISYNVRLFSTQKANTTLVQFQTSSRASDPVLAFSKPTNEKLLFSLKTHQGYKQINVLRSEKNI